MNSKQLNVSVILPNYNGELLLKKNLPSVMKSWQNPKNKIKEVIVVDDGSSDKSIEILNTEFPKVKVLTNEKNFGFPITVNKGVKSAKGSIVVLLNTDVSVAVNFLESVLPLFADEKLFGVSLHEKGYGPSKCGFKDGFFIHGPAEESKNTHITAWMSGGSSAIRTDLWKKLDGLDEELLSPYYWEDVDLGYRALKRGYKLLWEPKSVVVHEHESTTSKIPKAFKMRIQERNHLLFIWKNMNTGNYIRAHIMALAKRLIVHPGYLRIIIMALMKIGTVARKRNIEKSESKVSDEFIFSQFNI